VPRSALALALLAVVSPCVVVAQGSSIIAITHVNVVDGTSDSPRRDQTVLVRGNRIAGVGSFRTLSIPPEAQVIRGRGKYLIPGLWDMHVHTVTPGGRETLPLYVVNGVTGVRDMASAWVELRAWRQEIAAGALVGPRIVASGPYIEGGDVPIPHLLARNAGEASVAVDSLVRLGVDFVKLHAQLTRDVYFAVARAARERRIPFTGHVPRSVSASEASDSGQHSLEHLLQIPIACTSAESLSLAPRFREQRVLGQCTSQPLDTLFRRFVENETRVVPTLVAAFEIAQWPKRELPGDAFAGHLPEVLRAFVRQIFPMPDSIPADADRNGNALFAKRVALVGAMHRAGVRLMPGTDAPLRNSPPGFGLHAELELFVQAGMTPLEVLRAATLEPAQYFGMADSSGAVATGMLADLVLIDADPLASVSSLRRVNAVIANGRVFERQEIERILAQRP
jgi:imidazolonepropionase-like amidohydrolase